MIVNEREHCRKLPHFQNSLRTYFVTFVTNHHWILPPSARDIVFAAMTREHQVSAFLNTAVVMPDHVHMILEPFCGSDDVAIALSEILRLIKGRSAREINQLLRRKGPVWRSESFDHQIRSDESMVQKCEYVAQNPVRKGLCASPDDWPWLFRAGRDG